MGFQIEVNIGERGKVILRGTPTMEYEDEIESI